MKSPIRWLHDVVFAPPVAPPRVPVPRPEPPAVSPETQALLERVTRDNTRTAQELDAALREVESLILEHCPVMRRASVQRDDDDSDCYGENED